MNHAIIDGEVVVQDGKGRTRFGDIQADIADDRADRMIFYAFDLLYLDGLDIRAAPLVDRKRVLAGVIEKAGRPIFYSEHFETDGANLFAQACKLGLEGIISKSKGHYRACREGLANDVAGAGPLYRLVRHYHLCANFYSCVCVR